MTLAATRLAEERKRWRKDHPFGFVCKPSTKADGTTDLMLWNALVPGKKGTLWEGAKYPLTLRFSAEYPANAPVVSFPAGFKHPNVFENGSICLSLIGKAWRPSVSLKEILLGVQELLDTPNHTDPANWEINSVFIRHRAKYDKMVKEQALKYKSDDLNL